MTGIIVIISIPIAAFYSMIYLYCIYRSFFFKDFAVIWKKVKFLYMISSIHTMLRSIYFWVVSFVSFYGYEGSISMILIYNIGEFIILSIFLNVFWIVLRICIITHQSLENHMTGKRFAVKLVLYSILSSNLMLGVGVLVLVFYYFGILGNFHIKVGLMVANFSFGIFSLGLIGYIRNILFKNPYKSTKARDIQRDCVKVLLVWVAGRIFHSFFIMANVIISEFDPIETISQYSTAIPELIDFLICEILGFCFVLNESFFKTLYRDKSDIEVTNSFLALVNEIQSESDITEWSSEDMGKNIGFGPILSSQLTRKKTLYSEKYKLGEIYLGSYMNKSIIIRRIILHCNIYLIEDLKQEISYLKRITNSSLIPLIGAVIQPPVIDLISPYIVNGSLNSAIHKKNMIFSFRDKLRIAKEIALTMKDLHYNGIVHGHLTSYNVLLDSDWKVLISDVGLNQLRKFAGFTIKYCNKSAWSSPEQLITSCPIVSNPSFTDDVYSYGMILWEIFTEKLPYQGFEWKKLRKIVIGGYTPGVPKNLKDSIKELLNMCWNSDPLLRPSFSRIVYQINKIENSDKHANI
jgi:Protein tyrosine and serine/threonine kinase